MGLGSTVQVGAVAVDLRHSYIYWGDHGTKTLSKAGLNGSNPQVIVRLGKLLTFIVFERTIVGRCCLYSGVTLSPISLFRGKASQRLSVMHLQGLNTN